MKKYELYKIISVYKSDGAADVMPNLSRQAHHQLEIFFWRSAFLETADQTSQCDYRPIVIGNRSIGAPLHLIKHDILTETIK